MRPRNKIYNKLINFCVTNEGYEKINAHALKNGYSSISTFIRDCIKQGIDRNIKNEVEY